MEIELVPSDGRTLSPVGAYFRDNWGTYFKFPSGFS